jgi:hypothetical protein
MGRGNPNWIRAAKERRALALQNEPRPGLGLGGLLFAALLGVAIAAIMIGIARSKRGEQ